MATQEAIAVDPLSTIHRYIDAFNEGDVKGMAAAFAVPGSILDGMPPHVWSGPTAAEDWYRDVLINTKKEGASDFFVTVGAPQHMEVSGRCCLCGSPGDHAVQSPRQTHNPVGCRLYHGPPKDGRWLA